MAEIRFKSMPTDQAEAYWAGAPDANGHEPETHVSKGDGVPCRHCQEDVAEGGRYLILAYRPFPRPQPYAEIGPIGMLTAPAEAFSELTEGLPADFVDDPRGVYFTSAAERHNNVAPEDYDTEGWVRQMMSAGLWLRSSPGA